jgi:hypothetical protein
MTTTTHPGARLCALTSYGGMVVATWQTGPDTFRAQYFTGDDWQWTGVCDSPERARFLAWRGMTEGRAAA